MTVFSSTILNGSALDLRELETLLADSLAVDFQVDWKTSTGLITGTTLTVLHDVSIVLEEDEIATGFFNCNVAQNSGAGEQAEIVLTSTGLNPISYTYQYRLVNSQLTTRGASALGFRIHAEGDIGGGSVFFSASARHASGAGAEFRRFNTQWVIITSKKQKLNDRLFV